jgi:alkaline phosphatase/alkaline phosphatase D
VIGNQVVLADATLNGAVLNYDQWDGYPAQRERISPTPRRQQRAERRGAHGDIHLGAVAQLRAGDRATGTPVGAEFITTSISSED